MDIGTKEAEPHIQTPCRVQCLDGLHTDGCSSCVAASAQSLLGDPLTPPPPLSWAVLQQSGLPTGLGYTPPFLLHTHRRANTLWCLSSDERRNNLGVLAGRAHVDTFEWLTVLGPRLLRWLVG